MSRIIQGTIKEDGAKMKDKPEIRIGWVINTGNPKTRFYDNYIGVFWFDFNTPLKPWHDGMRVAIFKTRKIARLHLAKVKGEAIRGKYPHAFVERIEVIIRAV